MVFVEFIPRLFPLELMVALKRLGTPTLDDIIAVVFALRIPPTVETILLPGISFSFLNREEDGNNLVTKELIVVCDASSDVDITFLVPMTEVGETAVMLGTSWRTRITEETKAVVTFIAPA
jgi:hypothetical protein